MFIRSERLFLRPCWPEDLGELAGMLGQEDVARCVPAHLWTQAGWPEPCDNDVRAPEQRLPAFLITLPTSQGQTIIGAAALSRWEGQVELFHCIAPSHRGRGYATEAVRALLAQSQALGHARLVASHFTDDPTGGRVLEKAGFRPTGVIRLRRRHSGDQAAPAAELAVTLAAAHGNDDPEMRAA
jgi:RimJ/RimL family protein N-acetyltransferase